MTTKKTKKTKRTIPPLTIYGEENRKNIDLTEDQLNQIRKILKLEETDDIILAFSKGKHVCTRVSASTTFTMEVIGDILERSALSLPFPFGFKL